jgi:hypothetical protein
MVEYFKDEFRGTKTCKTTDEDYCWIIKEYRDDLTANTGSFTRTYIQHGYTIGINISRSDGSFSRNSLHDEDGFRDSIDISGTCELKTETLKF